MRKRVGNVKDGKNEMNEAVRNRKMLPRDLGSARMFNDRIKKDEDSLK